MTYKLYFGDCLEVLPTLEKQRVDAVITDLPYGTTQCSWDAVIPLVPMWEQVERVLKPNGIFITTAGQPFTSLLITSKLEWFRQALVWDKVLPLGFLDANRKHLRSHEDIVLFSPTGRSTYNPKMIKRGPVRQKGSLNEKKDSPVYGHYKQQRSYSNTYYPTTIIRISNGDHTRKEVGFHPTQKPVSLMTYLVDTFTNPGDTVLDFCICMGSGSTGVACMPLRRNFIGCENDPKYYTFAEQRIKEATMQEALFV